MSYFVEHFPGLDVSEGNYTRMAAEIAALLPGISEQAWGELREGGRQQIQPRGREHALYDASAERAFEILRGLATGYINNDIRLGINRYQPGGSGEWHTDYPPFLPVYVLGLTDINEPSFEHAGTAPDMDMNFSMAHPGKNAGGLIIKSGDLVKVSGRGLQHRGVSPTKDMRYTGIFYTFSDCEGF